MASAALNSSGINGGNFCANAWASAGDFMGRARVKWLCTPLPIGVLIGNLLKGVGGTPLFAEDQPMDGDDPRKPRAGDRLQGPSSTRSSGNHAALEHFVRDGSRHAVEELR